MMFMILNTMPKYLLAIVILCMSLVTSAQINLDSGLVGHFPFDGNANDMSVIGVDGLVTNAVLTPGKTGNVDSAYYFNGTNAFIDFDTTNRNVTDEITISAWVKTTDTGLVWIVGKYDWTVDRGYHLLVFDGHPFIAGRNNGGLYVSTNYPNPTLLVNDGNWHFLLAEIKGNEWSMTVDCVLDTSVTSTSPLPDLRNSQPLTVGYFFLGSNGDHLDYEGSVDEVRIYNRTLSADEKQVLCKVDLDTTVFLAPKVSNDTTVCSSSILSLSAYADSGMIYWDSPLGSVIDSGNTHTDTITANTTFYVYSIMNGKISDTAIIQVDTMTCAYVVPAPIIPQYDPVCIDTILTLSAQSDTGLIYWLDSNKVVLDTGLTYDALITEDVTYYVYSELNGSQSDTVSIEVEVYDCAQSVFPNIFTPNGDGVNDYLRFTIPNNTCFELVIYNRWGIEVFKSLEMEIEWDGRILLTGEPVTDGIYYYSLTHCMNGASPETTNGTISIFR